jgi:hypothetical protein
MSRSVFDRQDDCDHVAWWLDAAGTFARSRPPGQRGRLGEPDQLAELALPGGQLAPADGCSWRCGGRRQGSWYRSGGGSGPGTRIVARPRIGMNQQSPAAVDPIVSGSLDPPGDGAIDRQVRKRLTRQADRWPRSFIDRYLNRRRSKVVERFVDAVMWPLRDMAIG